MEITLAGGAVIDIASHEDLAEHHRKLAELVEGKRPRGRYYMVSGSTVTTAGFTGSGPIAVPFTPDSPGSGRLWFVQWISVFVALSPAAAAVANLNAAVAVGRCPTGPGAPSALAVPVNTGDIVVPGQAVPSAVSVPDKTVVKSQTQLYVLLAGSGLVASTAYNVVAGVLDTPDDDEVYFW